MERKLAVLLVEDDENECLLLKECAEKMPDINLVATTNSSVKAFALCEQYEPNVVILELELHHGSGSGLLFLEDMQSNYTKPRPYLVVTTNNTSLVTYNQARTLNADYIFSKSQSDYSPQLVMGMLSKLKNSIWNAQKKGFAVMQQTIESGLEIEQRIAQKIFVEMNLIGINPKVKGRNYLQEAIALFINAPQANICTVMAKDKGVTPTSIERAMQGAIVTAWSRNHPDELLKHYTAYIRPEKAIPTLMEFISYYADKIKKMGY